jgi:hypothetical protein
MGVRGGSTDHERSRTQLVTKTVTNTTADPIRLAPIRPYRKCRASDLNQVRTGQVRQDRLTSSRLAVRKFVGSNPIAPTNETTVMSQDLRYFASTHR